MSKKWKTPKSKAPVDVFKKNKSLYEELTEDAANYKILVNRMIDGRKVVEAGNRALVELLYKVKDVRESSAKKFWIDRLEAISQMTSAVSAARDRLLLIESEYKNLYSRYSEVLDLNKELADKLLQYESEQLNK